MVCFLNLKCHFRGVLGDVLLTVDCLKNTQKLKRHAPKAGLSYHYNKTKKFFRVFKYFTNSSPLVVEFQIKHIESSKRLTL